MHFSGGGGGHGGGGGMGHSSGGHSGHAGGHASGGHGGEGGLSIGQILGLNHGHGGAGLFGHLAHMLGGHHGAVHHNHHAGGEPDQSPSWNMAMQAEKNGLGGFLRKKLRFTPAVGFFFLFIFLTFWLGVIYQLRHHEPTENFSAISKQLYGQQLPTTRVDGQTLPTVGVSDPANAGRNPLSQAGSPQGFPGAASTPMPAQTLTDTAQASMPQSYQMQQRQPFQTGGYGAPSQVAYGRFGGGSVPAYSTPTPANSPSYAVYGRQPGMYAPATAFGA
jgi:hypothetical protein